MTAQQLEVHVLTPVTHAKPGSPVWLSGGRPAHHHPPGQGAWQARILFDL
jgi:hypothetical protein